MLHHTIFVGVGALIVSPVLAISFPTPQATDTTADKYDVIGFSPKPTSPPTPKDLRARSFGRMQPRDLTDTCAYWEGEQSEPYNCGIGSACLYNTASYYFGCCSVDGSGDFLLSDCPAVADPYTSCYEYTDASYCTGACYDENRVCDATLPYCGVNYLLAGLTTYTQYFCNSLSSDASLTWYTTYTDAAAPTTSISDPSTTSSPDGSTSSSSSVEVFNFDGPTTTPSGGSTTSASSSSSSSITSNPTPKPSHSDVGAIAGGVVGGLAALAAIVAVTILVLYRRKQKQREKAHVEISQVPT